MAERRRRDAEAAAARPFWSGTISFGLVSIPVALFPANHEGRVAMRMLGREGRPITRRWLCPEEKREVPSDEVVRGREVDGRWIVVRDEELEALEPRKSRDIDLRAFVPADAVPPLYFERAYYLAPAGQTTKAYRLLAQVMEDTGRAGIATFVMRGREYLVGILARGGILRAETLRFADEVRAAEDVGVPRQSAPSRPAVRRMERAIHAAVGREVPRDLLVDRHAEALRDLARRKYERGTDVVTVDVPVEGDEEAVDLVATIRASLQRRGVRSAAAPARRAGGRRRTGESKQALLARAKALDIPDRSRMTKAQLARAIRRRAA